MGNRCRRTVNGIELFTLGWSGPHASARRSAARAAGGGWEGDTPRLRRPTGHHLAGGRPAALPTAPGEVVLRTRQGAAGDQAQRWPLGPCHPKSLGGAGSGSVLPPGTWGPGRGTGRRPRTFLKHAGTGSAPSRSAFSPGDKFCGRFAHTADSQTPVRRPRIQLSPGRVCLDVA